MCKILQNCNCRARIIDNAGEHIQNFRAYEERNIFQSNLFVFRQITSPFKNPNALEYHYQNILNGFLVKTSTYSLISF